ncbi:MAG: PTS sugar transporter subunit IIA [Desulfatibacillaceae bacterium]
MIGIVVVTHKNLGAALIEAAEFVIGKPLENTVAVSIDLKESADKLRQDISNGVKSVEKDEGVLILTDMFGGTPSNLSYSFLEDGRIEVISGVNLPILIRAVRHRQKKDLQSLAVEVAEYGMRSICMASNILKGNKRTG